MKFFFRVFSFVLLIIGVGAALPGMAEEAADGSGSPDHVLYVDVNASGSDDGQSWVNAFPNLQDALAEARTLAPAESVEIWVANGVYYPDIGGSPSGNTSFISFDLVSNVSLYGGFAGGETALDQRDWQANPTVLSGDIDNNDTVNAIGVAEHYDDLVGRNSLHVVQANLVDNSARLDGFYITGGMADGGGIVDGVVMRYGAGLYVEDSQLTLANLQIQGNRTRDLLGRGGGAYFENSAPGPSIAPLQIQDVAVINNLADDGGGFYVRGTELSIDGAVFAGNVASWRGGAMFKNIVVFQMRNALIAGNRAIIGGGIYGFRGVSALVNTQISGNYASEDGGGYYFDLPPDLNQTVVLTNTTFSGNRADRDGGAIFHEQAPVGTMLINNSILWGNQDVSGPGTASASYGGPGAGRFTATHSLIEGLNPAGTGNLDGTVSSNDPLFSQPLDPATAPSILGDLRVAASSPIIDQGTGTARINPSFFGQTPIPIEGNIAFDLDGQERFADGLGDSFVAIDL
ncbi:MAG: hypothetical protein V2J20_07045, partial [Wenzhouxiangella sp.]|nr:hypothetical protein [Wenzhouxiangella sp.]